MRAVNSAGGHYHVAMGVKIYGIRNCDTMKKAFVWLDSHAVAYDFHDYKKLGVTEAALAGWSNVAGWEKVLNRAGTTFRKLPDAEKEGLTKQKAIALMLAQPSMIKRPVLEKAGKITAGFRPEQYEKLLGR